LLNTEKQKGNRIKQNKRADSIVQRQTDVMDQLPPSDIGGTPFPQQLKEGKMIKRRQSILVEEYMIKPESGLDGSINGALNISPALVQRNEKRVWVRAKTITHVEDEEGDL
jgi:hypothetical protein